MPQALREELKQALKENRTRSPIDGSSDDYWESVVDTIETFLDDHFKEENEES